MSNTKPGLANHAGGLVGAAVAALLMSAAACILLGLLLRFMWEMFLLGWNF